MAPFDPIGFQKIQDEILQPSRISNGIFGKYDIARASSAMGGMHAHSGGAHGVAGSVGI